MVLVTILSAASTAATCGQRITEKEINNSNLHLEMATNYLEQDQILDARREAYMAIQANPQNAEAHFTLGYIFAQLSEWGKAEESAMAALKYAKHYPEASNLLGVILIEQGRYEEAIKILLDVIEDFLYTTPHLAYGNLGLAYLKLGQHQDAIEVLERAVELQPMFCTGFYRLGLVYYDMNRFKDALESLKKSVIIEDPWGQCEKLTNSYSLMGKIHLELDDQAEALESFQECYELEPDTAVGLECRKLGQSIEPPEAGETD
jgi:type IV pilus biogenesis/stability protein PilW